MIRKVLNIPIPVSLFAPSFSFGDHRGQQIAKFMEIIVWSCVAVAFPVADLVLHLQEILRSRASSHRAFGPVMHPAVYLLERQASM
jgi:hypothetical protein